MILKLHVDVAVAWVSFKWNVSMKRNKRCEQQKITNIRTSNESHFYWKIHFHRNLLYFWIFAVFTADIVIDFSIIGHKTTKIYKQNPVYIGDYIASETIDILESCYYDISPGHKNVFSFVNEALKKIKMASYFKNTNKDILLSGKD